MRLLGTAAVFVGDEPTDVLGSPRLQSLLAQLVVNRHAPQCRQRLAFLFSPDSSESQARTNLRHALHQLRHVLPDPDRLLHVDTQTVRWLPDGPAVVDVVAFDAACEKAETSGSRDDLERAVGLYTGDLLPASYEDWVEPERHRLRRRYGAVLGKLVELTEESGDYAVSIEYAERLVRLDPADEEGYRRLMALHLRAGQRARALHVLHECVSMLERELRLSVPWSRSSAERPRNGKA